MAGNSNSILTPQQNQLLGQEKTFFDALRQAVDRFGADPEDRRLLAKVITGLDELFLLVVVGEFNSGKSAFINALVGQKALAEGATPTTDQINVLRYGPEPDQQQREPDLLEVFNPATFLQEISIVDTPGTNAVIERHQVLTEEFVPRSDMVIFVTSAERPFTQSERQFLEKVKNWGKKILVVINKIDLLETQEDYRRVVQFVTDGFRQLLDLEPPIFPVSGRTALQAKTQPGPQTLDNWRRSGFGPLEDYIFNTLDQASRIRLKFLSPLLVAERLSGRYLGTIDERLSLLAQDASTVETIERHLAVFQEDMKRDFTGRLANIDNMIYEMNRRGDAFFDDVLKVTRLFDMIKTDRIKHDFEQRVVSDTPHRIEQAVNEMVEWTVERESRIWQEITEYLRERRQAGGDENLIGRADNAFEQFNLNRRALLQQVGERARTVVQSFDHRVEAEKLNVSVRDAVARTTLTEIGAIGLGAGLVLLLGSAAADVTGILLSVVVGGVGFFIIPARRRKAKYELRHKLETLRTQLTGVLKEQFEHELTLAVERVREAIAPYTRFIRLEQERLTTSKKEFQKLREEMARLQTAIEKATPGAAVGPVGQGAALSLPRPSTAPGRLPPIPTIPTTGSDQAQPAQRPSAANPVPAQPPAAPGRGNSNPGSNYPYPVPLDDVPTPRRNPRPDDEIMLYPPSQYDY
ncbi:MAG: dynamin family protein [Chloroflexi bacterium]|nr:dynamin family protein [Chloroflexota bacterium]